jgi:hypothetical protein
LRLRFFGRDFSPLVGFLVIKRSVPPSLGALALATADELHVIIVKREGDCDFGNIGRAVI